MKKRILVTGASRGIGRAIAIEAARRGYDPVLHFLSSADAAREAADATRAPVPRPRVGASLSHACVAAAACADVISAACAAMARTKEARDNSFLLITGLPSATC